MNQEDPTWKMFEDKYVYYINGNRVMFLNNNVVHCLNHILTDEQFSNFVLNFPINNVNNYLDNMRKFLNIL